MNATSTIEISESALRDNLTFLRRELGETRLSCVVKGNAYGHGIDTYVPLAHRCGVEHFSVFSANEAFEAHRALSGKAEIMIMGMIENGDLEWVIKNDISFFVFDLRRLEHAIGIAKRLKRQARIHLELDTGMNRTGFEKKTLKHVAEVVDREKEHLIVEGLCTHYAGAESIANYKRVRAQYRRFNKYCERLHERGVIPRSRHTACSAAAMSYPKSRMDLARIGIMQYGFWPSKETLITYLNKQDDKVDPLRRVISWKTRIMTMQDIKAGEFVGYGTSFMADSDMRVAVLPVGYAHGYSRSLSNLGRILVHGQRLGVIGMVNMNMTLVDVTHIPEAQVGDEAILIGQQGDLSISVASFGEATAQLNYELLTRLPHDTPRIITP